MEFMTSANQERTLKFPKFHGETGAYFGIWIVNILLTILTVGIYSPWAKVRNLKYLYGATELEGARFDFHGSPIAILKGRVIAAILFGFYLLGSRIHPVFPILTMILIYFAVPWLIVQSLRFRFGNTSYRNLRFSFRGRVSDAYSIWLKYTIVPFIIMGAFSIFMFIQGRPMGENSDPTEVAVFGSFMVAMIVYGFALSSAFLNSAWRFIYRNTYYGQSRAGIISRTGEVFTNVVLPPLLLGLGSIVLAIILVISATFLAKVSTALGIFAMTLIVLVIIASYVVFLAIGFVFTYMAIHYIWNRVHLDDCKTVSHLQLWKFLRITVVNTLAVGLSLGLLYPWAKIRYKKYTLENRGIEIDNLDRFTGGNQESSGAVGEEVGDAFDIGFEIGL